jgi:3',5'-cyclic AMP phosphodiesterase CpdA
VHDELLDKAAVLDEAAQVAAAAPPAAVATGPRAWLGALALRRGLAEERKTLRRAPSAQDRKSYLPRSLVLSFFQAHREQHAEAWTATGPAFAEGVGPAGFDYHWVTDFLTELATHIVRRVFFAIPAGGPATVPLAPDARLVLVGDWGTGEGVALAVAEQMRRQIDAAGNREVHVVHLGDVYYAGTRWEARNRFLDHWPVRQDEVDRVRSWCLNGNHDMYAAGEGLFDVILADGRFRLQHTARGRRTSEFHLRNDDWDVAGLDTAWRFHPTDVSGQVGHLELRQRRWLTTRLVGSARRRMLMTHHQPFTQRGGAIVDSGNLLSVTAALRVERAIDAWFWGHEHKLIAYAARSGVGYGVCMGHGAVLEAPATAPPAAGAAEYPATFRDADGDEWRMPGFTVVDLDGPRATVRYLDMHGAEWRAPDAV